MRLFVINRYADNLNVFLIKDVARITERTRFLGSARRVVFGVKPKHDTFAAKVFELNRVAVLIL
jgi:hypothetical protein